MLSTTILSHPENFFDGSYPPPVALSGPIQHVHFAVSPQYGHTQLQSSIKLPQFKQRG